MCVFKCNVLIVLLYIAAERIKSSSGDWYLSVKDGNTTPGTPVVVDVKNDKQQWKRLHIMMGAFYIISTLDNQLKLTVLDVSFNNLIMYMPYDSVFCIILGRCGCD